MYLYQKHNLSYPIIWIESGLHNTPKKLHKRIQKELDQISQTDILLLGFGQCGNSLNNILTGNYETILPRTDDCISLFFGSDAARNAYGQNHRAIYLTAGWMRGEQNILKEYAHAYKRFGAESAKDLMHMMYDHYQELVLLDTGIYSIDQLYEETADIEKITDLKRVVLPATLSYLEKLLLGPWKNEEFYHFKPNSTITIKHG
ncbi:MAG: DUF1638 domain-containing protein [Lachnospiraceae bacterium]|nr:DUF1638 domain-containing protein [Lachnospiraceae bacterium]